MTTLKLTKIDTSAGSFLPKEMLARLKVEKGDTLYSKKALLLLHEESLATFGGPSVIRDEGLLTPDWRVRGTR